jgi:hypothetical protein
LKRTIKLNNDVEALIEIDDFSMTVSVWQKDDTLPTGWAYNGEHTFTLPPIILPKYQQKGKVRK